ncbi:histidine phosphatase family protein [Pseudomonas brassicacearum]|uniref:Histidine phosphatase family protein n=1 Tax=Pseudomonas brassicacearum TaxID=930166 RepID=A0A423GX28_9PSED|nr:histidine phosphatase family protein [Pseudomonas brassicacearum]RON02457.1 histidine phosphatase family protein [Pseudomonas brassicacearum]
MMPSIPTPVHLYLVRHGETEWTLSRQHTGRTDIPLTARGESEAKKLASHLRDIPFTHVLTSPLRRAQQTCVLAGQGTHAVIVPDLAEWDYGDYEGQRSVDILKQRKGWNLFRDGCPQGESPAQIAHRADQVIARLRALEGNVALFSHGQFASVLAVRWIGLSLIAAQHFPLDTASLSILTYDTHHPDVPVIALWNAFSDD